MPSPTVLLPRALPEAHGIRFRHLGQNALPGCSGPVSLRSRIRWRVLREPGAFSPAAHPQVLGSLARNRVEEYQGTDGTAVSVFTGPTLLFQDLPSSHRGRGLARP